MPGELYEHRPRNWVLYGLVVGVGVSSWLVINAVWSELAVFANVLPEGWAIASYIVLAVECANVCPLCYVLISKLFLCLSKGKQYWTPEASLSSTIAIMQSWGVLMCTILACAWNIHPFSSQHSGIFLLAIAGQSAMATLSSLVYFPFSALFPSSGYTSAMQLGVAFSGAIPSILGFVQAPGTDHQRFSVDIFFWCICLVQVLTFLCLVSIVLSQWGFSKLNAAVESVYDFPSVNYDMQLKISSSKNVISWYNQFWVLLLNSFLLNGMENGILTQISTYACMPYGNQYLELQSLLCLLLPPLGCFVPILILKKPVCLILVAIIYFIFFPYILAAALMSPDPVLIDNPTVGGSIMVFVYVSIRVLIAYTKTVNWMQIHERMVQESETHKNKPFGDMSMWAGCAQQGGSFFFCMLFFSLINFTSLFNQ
ncbi:solute carrier family 52, riboflavin transporter, member 3-B [Pelomyxa schiedti]|nr:solute carrier family 52, riboflavin transporter, member 3-B [Pelomyxa schiedti]